MPVNYQWFPISKFTGFNTNLDPTKVDIGANSQGQNSTVNEGDRISVRQFGTDIFPTKSTLDTGVNPTTSIHTFRKRAGENIMMQASGGVLKYSESGNQTWTVLQSGYKSSDFGFSDYNINTDQSSYTYFGNAVDNFSRWNGSHTTLTIALVGGETVIPVVSTADFVTPPAKIVINGVTYTYIALTPTSFTISTPIVGPVPLGSGVAQAIEEFPMNPKGNIYLNVDNRLFIAGINEAGVPKFQQIYFSKYGDATLYTGAALVASNTAASPGIFNLAEGGGGVVRMTTEENSIYIFKRSIIYRATLTDSIYSLQPLKTFDDKSQTVGAVNKRSTFAGGNGIVFVTPDKQIMYLTRVEQVDYPQNIPISYNIKFTIENAVFDTSAGVVFNNRIFLAAKSSSQSSVNDVVFVYNLNTKAWDSPIVGWNVADWTIYDAGDGNGDQLYFADAVSNNVFQVNSTPLDYIFPVKANWRSKEIDFDNPFLEKVIDNVFLYGFIAPNTQLTVSLLLDNNGFTQKYVTTILGTETGFIFNQASYNVFGFNMFGTERFGSNADQSGKKPFRIYLNKNFRYVPFYTAQIEFASDGENQAWEIILFAFHYAMVEQGMRRSLFRKFQ